MSSGQAAVLGDEADDHQERRVRLADVDALLLTICGSSGVTSCSLFCTLTRDARIRAASKVR